MPKIMKTITHSSFILLGRAIKGKRWTFQAIVNALKKIDRDDYAKSDIPQLVSHLRKLTMA